MEATLHILEGLAWGALVGCVGGGPEEGRGLLGVFCRPTIVIGSRRATKGKRGQPKKEELARKPVLKLVDTPRQPR